MNEFQHYWNGAQRKCCRWLQRYRICSKEQKSSSILFHYVNFIRLYTESDAREGNYVASGKVGNHRKFVFWVVGINKSSAMVVHMGGLMSIFTLDKALLDYIAALASAAAAPPRSRGVEDKEISLLPFVLDSMVMDSWRHSSVCTWAAWMEDRSGIVPVFCL